MDNKFKIGVGVGALILKDNKVLLGLRNPNKVKASSELKGQGTWTMPGGKVEFHETLEDAVIRELEEETSLKATKQSIFSIQDDFSDTAHYVTVCFLIEEYEGNVQTMEPETILRWEWFDINDLPTNMYMPSKKGIENYLINKLYK